MVTNKIHIENYKSIKKLDLDCKRINLFIGEPNSGKSNILEALSFFSPNAMVANDFKKKFRFDKTTDLFYDSELNNPILIATRPLKLTITYGETGTGAISNQFDLSFWHPKDISPASLSKEKRTDVPLQKPLVSFNLNHDGLLANHSMGNFDTKFRYYEYQFIQKFNTHYVPFLNCPYGENIPSLLLSNSKLRKMVSMFFVEKGYRMLIEPITQELKIAKDINDTLITYPYSSISDTLKRVVFLMLAIESNQDSAIIIDEPESNTFPFYTKYIAERIAFDKKNQYFLTTHNPYLLANIIQRTPVTDLNLCVVRMDKYETKVFPLSSRQKEMAVKMDVDVFFNLDKLIK
jgi:AAA15 family ATPase/GTPase